MFIRGLLTKNIVFTSLLLAVAFTLLACGGRPSKGVSKKAIFYLAKTTIMFMWLSD
jgi:hypothetical protein